MRKGAERGPSTYAYDDAGQLTSETTTLFGAALNPAEPGDTTHNVTYGYDPLGRRQGFTTTPSGLIIGYAYNNQDQLVTQTAYAFDVAGQLASIQHANASDPIAAFAYQHEILGDITRRQETYGTAPADEDLYTSDLTRQSVSATYGHKDTTADARDHFSYVARFQHSRSPEEATWKLALRPAGGGRTPREQRTSRSARTGSTLVHARRSKSMRKRRPRIVARARRSIIASASTSGTSTMLWRGNRVIAPRVPPGSWPSL